MDVRQSRGAFCVMDSNDDDYVRTFHPSDHPSFALLSLSRLLLLLPPTPHPAIFSFILLHRGI